MVNEIAVLGANGYAAKSLLSYLSQENFGVRCIARSEPEKRYEKFQYFIFDILDQKKLAEAIAGVDIVVDLAAVVRTIKKSDYQKNVEMTKAILAAMKEAKVENLLHFSTQNVYIQRKGPYAKSKEEAERWVRESDRKWAILRPNYIFGVDKENFIYQMARMIANMHFAATIGNGRNFLQPILKDDLSKVTIEIIKKFKPGTAYDISGGDTLSVNLIITKIENLLKTKQRRVRIPSLLLKPIKKFITFDLDGFNEDRFAKEIYKYEYTPFDDILPKIVELAKENS